MSRLGVLRGWEVHGESRFPGFLEQPASPDRQLLAAALVADLSAPTTIVRRSGPAAPRVG